VPFSLKDAFYLEPIFWVGLLFVTFPLNYLVYGLNDYNDLEADEVNLRKGNFLFGAKASRAQLDKLPRKITLVMLPFVIYFTWIAGWQMLLLLIFMVVINLLYNFKPFRFKERPPFEIFIQVGYVFTVIFSVVLNDLSMISWQTVVYLCLFAFQAHIAGEIMDIEPDLLANKKTTATLIGRKNTKLLMLVILITETFLLLYWFEDYILSAFLGVFSIWLILDIWIFFKDKPYSVPQMKFFGICMNIVALLSMAWVLYSGTLLAPKF